eukprot:10548531-Heterocapsa_arctica.AAC.1
MTEVAAGISGTEQLQVLAVDCCGCSFFADPADMSILGSLKEVRRCEFDFSDTAVSSVDAIAHGISGMWRLKNLTLKFARCEALTIVAGLQGLSGLPELR